MNRRRTPVRRQIAVATWRPARDGRIYARMEVDVTAALAYLERVRAESGTRVTLTVPRVWGRMWLGSWTGRTTSSVRWRWVGARAEWLRVPAQCGRPTPNTTGSSRSTLVGAVLSTGSMWALPRQEWP